MCQAIKLKFVLIYFSDITQKQNDNKTKGTKRKMNSQGSTSKKAKK